MALSKGSRVIIKPNARLYQHNEKGRAHGKGIIPVYADERGTVVSTGPGWTVIDRDTPTFEGGEEFRFALVDASDLIEMDVIERLGEASHGPFGPTLSSESPEMPW